MRTENKIKNIHSTVQCVAVWILLLGAAAPLTKATPPTRHSNVPVFNAVMNLRALYKVGGSVQGGWFHHQLNAFQHLKKNRFLQLLDVMRKRRWRNACLAGMDGWMDGWIDGWIDEWMAGWMDGWIDR